MTFSGKVLLYVSPAGTGSLYFSRFHKRKTISPSSPTEFETSVWYEGLAFVMDCKLARIASNPAQYSCRAVLVISRLDRSRSGRASHHRHVTMSSIIYPPPCHNYVHAPAVGTFFLGRMGPVVIKSTLRFDEQGVIPGLRVFFTWFKGQVCGQEWRAGEGLRMKLQWRYYTNNTHDVDILHSNETIKWRLANCDWWDFQLFMFNYFFKMHTPISSSISLSVGPIFQIRQTGRVTSDTQKGLTW